MPLEYVSEWEVFRMLDNFQPTAAGLDGLPAWFLRVAAPIFCKTIAYEFNMSLASTSTVIPRHVERSYKDPTTIPEVPDEFGCNKATR